MGTEPLSPDVRHSGSSPPRPNAARLGYARRMADFIQVSTATPDRQAAVDLARSAVTERLAAGAQIIGPVTSAFWHNGEFGTGEEWQLLFKTRRELYAELEEHILRNHPWENPEIAAVAIVAGSAACLHWMETNTKGLPSAR